MNGFCISLLAFSLLSFPAALPAQVRIENASSQPVQPARGQIRGTVKIAQPATTGEGQSAKLGRSVVFLDAHINLLPQDPSRTRPVIAQKNKTFLPSFLVISKGVSVEFPNRDPYSHNVFSRSRTAQFDLGRYPKGVSKRYQFDQVGMNQLFCNIHPQMRAVVMVVPNRYFAQPDADGRFLLTDIPPGKYSLVVWHERNGSQAHQVEVSPGQESPIEIFIEPRPQRSRSQVSRQRSYNEGVRKGLGLKREQLNLPVVKESHRAPPDKER